MNLDQMTPYHRLQQRAPRIERFFTEQFPFPDTHHYISDLCSSLNGPPKISFWPAEHEAVRGAFGLDGWTRKSNSNGFHWDHLKDIGGLIVELMEAEPKAPSGEGSPVSPELLAGNRSETYIQ